MAAGRSCSQTTSVETVRLEPRGHAQVDLRVPGEPWLHAVGDVNGRGCYDMGKYQAPLAADRIAGNGHAGANLR